MGKSRLQFFSQEKKWLRGYQREASRAQAIMKMISTE